MIMCVLLCYPVSIHMSQLQATGRPISSFREHLYPSYSVILNELRDLYVDQKFGHHNLIYCLFCIMLHVTL